MLIRNMNWNSCWVVEPWTTSNLTTVRVYTLLTKRKPPSSMPTFWGNQRYHARLQTRFKRFVTISNQGWNAHCVSPDPWEVDFLRWIQLRRQFPEQGSPHHHHHQKVLLKFPDSVQNFITIWKKAKIASRWFSRAHISSGSCVMHQFPIGSQTA